MRAALALIHFKFCSAHRGLSWSMTLSNVPTRFVFWHARMCGEKRARIKDRLAVSDDCREHGWDEWA